MTMSATIPLNPAPATVCQRWIGSDGYLICDRCGSMWSPLLHNTGWLPSACVEKSRGEEDRGSNGSEG